MDEIAWKTSVPQQPLPDYFNEFIIELDPAQPVYYRGQMLNGYVILDLNEPKEITSITIKLTGSVKCYWKDEIELDDSPSCSIKSDSSSEIYKRKKEKPKKKIEVDHIDEKFFIYDHRCLYHTGFSESPDYCFSNDDLEEKNRLPQCHATGRTFYEFAFLLPEEPPTSFEGIYGYIRYSLEATVKRKDNTYITLYMLTINEIIDTNDSKYELDSQQYGRVIIGEKFIQQSDSEGCLWMKPDNIKMTASINRSCYCPGEAIFVNLDVLNKSNAVQFLRITLTQKVVYKAPTTNASKVIKSNLFVLESPPILKGQTYEWVDKPLAVPATVPTITNGELITVVYNLKFSVPLGEDTEIAISYFITIGSIPFFDAYEKSVDYGTADDWPITLPPKPKYIYGSTYAPVQTDLWGYPDLKPPAYSAPALTPAKAQYWLEKKTSYAPVYTYAEPYITDIPQTPAREPYVPSMHDAKAIKDFSIKLKSKQLVYYPGEILSGVVVLDLEWRLEIKKITLRVVGRAQTWWVHKEGEDDLYDKNTKLQWVDKVKEIKEEMDGTADEVPKFEGRETLFDSTVIILDCNFTGSKDAYTHRRGRFEYDFFFQLTQGLQSSFEGRHGNIRYFLQADLEMPGQLHITRYPIIVNSLIDTNHEKYELGKASFRKNITDYRKVNKFKLEIDAVFMEVALDRSCYCPGEGILFNLHIYNKTKFDIKKFQVRLVQKVAYTKGDHGMVLCTEVNKIIGPKIGKKEKLTWIDRALGIPAVVPTIITNSIRVNYILQFLVEVNKDVKPEMKFSIIVGTVPYIKYYGEELLYGTEDEPEEPPEWNEIEEYSSPPLNPTVFGYPYMHPPCYSAALKDITIPLKYGFNLKREKPYIPVYTFAKPYKGKYNFPGKGERDEYFKFGAADYVK